MLCGSCGEEYSANGQRTGRPAGRQTFGFPEPMRPEAFHGLIGDVVRAIEPHSEADPHAVLVQALVAFGNVIGRGPRFAVEADEHPAALYALIVGESAKARKGTSLSYIRRVIQRADSDYEDRRLVGGLSSGEGLVWAVRDATTKLIKQTKENPLDDDNWIEETTDPGIADKRLLAIESEFAQAFKVMARAGNTLSPTLRGLWDHGSAGMLTKNDPTRTANAHVSLIGHITRDELRRLMDATEQANGFANRFLFCCARRSKLLPHGGRFELDLNMALELSEAVKAAATVGRNGPIKRDRAADDLWEQVYHDLSQSAPGMLGSITSRAEAQVMRIALLYAALDGSTSIGKDHLAAALAVWDYCEASAKYVFGDATGDPVADEILTALRTAGSDGMTRTQIRDLFSRHRGDRVGGALTALDGCRARHPRPAGNGRPAGAALVRP